MFDKLRNSLSKVFDGIKSGNVITDSHIERAIREIRIALLDADVSIDVVKHFIENIKEKALGAQVVKSVSPQQMMVKIVNDEIINILDPDFNPELNEDELNVSLTKNNNDEIINLHKSKGFNCSNILLAGLQGSGKTTATAKLAFKFSKLNKKILLVSLDTYRYAAQEQLRVLSENTGADFFETDLNNPIDIAKNASKFANDNGYNVVLYDTAGRLDIDEKMIDEIKNLENFLNPSETLLVLDSMIGQESVNIAKNFNDALNITGVILSRIDGDAKGGVALSVRVSIGKKIKFLSVGEKLEDLENFDAKRIASRILGMGDIVSLVEKAEQLFDKEDTEKMSDRIKSGKFDLNDYNSQIKNISKIGGFTSVMSMIPGINKLSNIAQSKGLDDNMFSIHSAIIASMTPKERSNPHILNASRKKRIILGSGTSMQQMNKLLKTFKQIQNTMKQVNKMGHKSIMDKLMDFK